MTTTIIPTAIPVAIPLPVRASFPPTGGAADPELAPSVGFAMLVLTEEPICDGVVVRNEAVGSIEGFCVGNSVVASVNECDGWVLVMIGGADDVALVLVRCDVGDGAADVGGGASERRNNKIKKVASVFVTDEVHREMP